MRIAAIIALVVLAACGGSPSRDERARAIEAQVWSPYCPGRLLTECTTTQAGALRAEISRRVRAGQSDTQVVAWLRSNYGDAVLARPEPAGAGLVVWLVPLAVLLAGAGALGVGVRRWSRRTEPAEVDGVTPDEESLRRVREEVERGL